MIFASTKLSYFISNTIATGNVSFIKKRAKHIVMGATMIENIKYLDDILGLIKENDFLIAHHCRVGNMFFDETDEEKLIESINDDIDGKIWKISDKVMIDKFYKIIVKLNGNNDPKVYGNPRARLISASYHDKLTNQYCPPTYELMPEFVITSIAALDKALANTDSHYIHRIEMMKRSAKHISKYNPTDEHVKKAWARYKMEKVLER